MRRPRIRLAPIREAVKRFAKRLTRDRVTTGMEFAGVAAITYGAGQVYTPAGWIVGGLLGIGLAYTIDVGSAQ